MAAKCERCPKCGSENISQDEVDVGVGTIYSPAKCDNCGWSQEAESGVLKNRGDNE